ncbi:MAG: hypothetical protein MK212_04705 [Saprospiraceae bacterium]|nr:hypothetical protein [Saprospiraceae bacterium]
MHSNQDNILDSEPSAQELKSDLNSKRITKIESGIIQISTFLFCLFTMVYLLEAPSYRSDLFLEVELWTVYLFFLFLTGLNFIFMLMWRRLKKAEPYSKGLSSFLILLFFISYLSIIVQFAAIAFITLLFIIDGQDAPFLILTHLGLIPTIFFYCYLIFAYSSLHKVLSQYIRLQAQ